MEKLRLNISATFEVGEGLYASWTPAEQARAILSDMQRVMPHYVEAELYEQGAMVDEVKVEVTPNG